MFRVIASAMFIAMGFASQIHATEYNDAPDEVIQANWLTGGGSISNGGSLSYALSPQRLEDGSLRLCGAFQYRRGGGGVLRQVQQAHILRVNGSHVVRNFGWMPVVSSRQDLPGQTAKCRDYPSVQVPDNARFSVTVSRRNF
ncbi:MAG: hypothetical protein AAGF13_00325 [Pseudomonadota bacterium]